MLDEKTSPPFPKLIDPNQEKIKNSQPPGWRSHSASHPRAVRRRAARRPSRPHDRHVRRRRRRWRQRRRWQPGCSAPGPFAIGRVEYVVEHVVEHVVADVADVELPVWLPEGGRIFVDSFRRVLI